MITKTTSSKYKHKSNGITRSKMKKFHPVVHQNYAIEENNYTVFCKLLNRADKLESLGKTCFNCPYLYGILQGEGVECLWEDNYDKTFRTVTDPFKEEKRVSNLIKQSILKRG